MYYATHYRSPLGELSIACDETHNLVGIWFKNQKYFGENMLKNAIIDDNLIVFTTVKKWLDAYFSGTNPSPIPISLKTIGTPFQQDVWKRLQNIPYGQITTYGDIAKQIAKNRNLSSMSAQAVGNAIAHNPIAILIPCHRVIAANHTLAGYAGGIEKKQALLTLENIKI
ncbi:MAG: methylated-DNA--[protein]-cysteine S-methyltransferase [Breznakia sp.]